VRRSLTDGHLGGRIAGLQHRHVPDLSDRAGSPFNLWSGA
jgi:hypothetical protein